jgi:hypothetical protein
MKKRLPRNEAKKPPYGRANCAGQPKSAGCDIGNRMEEIRRAVDNTQAEHLSAIWRAVLVQHIMDAKSRSSKPESDYYRHKALHFLFDDKKDFRAVCELADLNPDVVRHKLHQARERGFIWRVGDGAQPTKPKPTAAREILIEQGVFSRLGREEKPLRQKHGGRASSHILALRQFSTQLELGF